MRSLVCTPSVRPLPSCSRMFDLRYHVASLVAVFAALLIGLLVGVALASHGLGNTERKRLEADLRDAQVQNDTLRAQLDDQSEVGASDSAFANNTYEAVMANRLKGKRVALLFVGSVDGDTRTAITRAVSDADGNTVRVRALKVPIDSTALSKRLSNGRPFLAAYAGRDQLTKLGHALGQEFVAGRDTPLWSSLLNLLVEERVGTPATPADAVVVVRSAPAQTGETALFLKGLYSGLRDVGVPAVGVEQMGGDGSSVDTFRTEHLSTVNNVNERAGKLALAILLSDGTVAGDFGAPPAANWLPPVPPVPTTSG
jgi:Copper transport outer membrane protein, MctB